MMTLKLIISLLFFDHQHLTYYSSYQHEICYVCSEVPSQGEQVSDFLFRS